MQMVRIFIRHAVADYASWRKGYDAFEMHRGPMGVTGHAVYQSIDDPNDVTVTHDFSTAEQAQALLASDVLKQAMAAAGVQGAPQVWITNAA